ncbi:MAG: cysteine--tRNA ligase [Ruminococcaceae bacterium]|nr:cysteine--tRNA ligase [Oscillospiraceae bacterium]
MKLFNDLSGKKEELGQKDNYVRMYACGPTVYNYFHVGNARCFVTFDLLRRFLEYRGNKVDFVQNFTDIDDKMIRRANEENTTVKEVADRYIAEYFKDAEGLGVLPATIHPRATENIDSIIKIIETLIEKGHAYESQGDVYYSARSFKDYGKLSGKNVDDLESGARIDVSDIKRDPLDFALWKASKPGEPFWESPWGNGRPGWHIECSAMVDKYLGKTIDIHCGGVDLTFPHHENEIAQSEGAFGVPFCRFWVHNGFINVDNKKMSKSLGNFFTVRDAAEKYGYAAIRYFILSAHYKSPVNFSAEILAQAQSSVQRLYNCEENLRFLLKNAQGEITPEETEFIQKLDSRREEFIAVMEDDFNTADGLATLFEAVKDINIFVNAERSRGGLEQILAFYEEICGLLGFLKPEEKVENGFDDEKIEALLAERAAAKKEKNYARADEIRALLGENGIVIEDTPAGAKWHRA